jgi:hypothetical protein
MTGLFWDLAERDAPGHKDARADVTA